MKKPLSSLTTEQIENKKDKLNKNVSRLTPVVFYGLLFLFLGIGGAVYGFVSGINLIGIISGIVAGISAVGVVGGFATSLACSYKEDTLEEEIKKRKLEEGLSKLNTEKTHSQQVEQVHNISPSPSIQKGNERIIPKMSTTYGKETKLD